MKVLLTAALAAWAISGGVALADGDAASGEKVFGKCKSCHAIGEGAKNKVGPQLNGIVGRPWGEDGTFKYSPALKELAPGKVWDDATLDAYLKKPKDVIPRGRMAFPGLRRSEQRADVIAYLKQFNADGSKAE